MEVVFNQTTMTCSEILNNNPLFELEIEDQRVMIKSNASYYNSQTVAYQIGITIEQSQITCY